MRLLGRLGLVALLAAFLLELGLRCVLGNLAIAGLLRWGLPDGRPFGLAAGARVDYTGYFLKLPPVVQEVNALGYRGPERPFARTSGASRIALVGSSPAYGVGVAEADTAAEQLERLLAPGTEVLNLGVPGMSVDELVPQVERFACRFEPDALVYVMSPRDLGPPMFAPEAPVRPELVAGLFRYVYSSRAAAVGIVAIVVVLQHVFVGPPVRAEVVARDKQRARRLLEQIVQMAQACPARLGIAVIAPLPGVDLAHQLASDPRTAGVPLLDATSLADDPALHIPHEGHLDAAGNRALARRLAAWIRESGLLPAPPAADHP